MAVRRTVDQMARPLRRDLPDGFFHITTRGVAQTLVHRDRDDYAAALRLLVLVVRRFDWEVHALCLMPTHHHVVVRCTREQLSRGMHCFNGRYAQAFNDRHNRHGGLFGDRFVSRVVEDEDYVREACRYVARNPVRAGLCDDVRDWPWSRSRYGVAESAEDD